VSLADLELWPCWPVAVTICNSVTVALFLRDDSPITPEYVYIAEVLYLYANGWSPRSSPAEPGVEADLNILSYVPIV